MQDSQGNSPLHYAAGYGRAEFVKDLIDAGAKGFKKNKSGHTPFDLVKWVISDHKQPNEKTLKRFNDWGLNFSKLLVQYSTRTEGGLIWPDERMIFPDCYSWGEICGMSATHMFSSELSKWCISILCRMENRNPINEDYELLKLLEVASSS